MNILLSLFSEYESQPQLEGRQGLGDGCLGGTGEIQVGENMVGSPLFFAGRGGHRIHCEAAGKTWALKRS